MVKNVCVQREVNCTGIASHPNPPLTIYDAETLVHQVLHPFSLLILHVAII